MRENEITRSITNNYLQDKIKTSYGKYAFSKRIVNKWNDLPVGSKCRAAGEKFIG